MTKVGLFSIYVLFDLWSLFKRKPKRNGEIEEKKKRDPEPDRIEQDEIGSEFMVTRSSDAQKKEEGAEEPREEIYRPPPKDTFRSDEDYEPGAQNSADKLKGYDVEVKELPEPEEEETDASWVELDIKRDFKHILKELESRKKNCYAILGIPENAGSRDIKKAYRTLASQYHPDRGTRTDGMSLDEINEKIREINYSKEILLDPTLRALHDKMLRENESGSFDDLDTASATLDPSILAFFPEVDREDENKKDQIVFLDEETDDTKGVGVLFFRKWEEDLENFTQGFFDYIVELDDQGYIDYGSVMKGDVSDRDELFRLKRVSNFSQAANNTLFDIWALPPFYYMAVPVLSRDYIQDVCDILKENFGLESIFFNYPLT